MIGTIEQKNPPIIPPKDSLLIPKEPVKKPTIYVVKNEPIVRLRECHSIEILSFKPPDLKLKVISDRDFSCRTLIHDLGLKLNTCAHLTDLCLKRIGVITTKDCLKKYELHLNQMIEAIDKYSNLCSKELKKNEDLKKNYRRII